MRIRHDVDVGTHGVGPAGACKHAEQSRLGSRAVRTGYANLTLSAGLPLPRYCRR